jgi:hypothetical protein
MLNTCKTTSEAVALMKSAKEGGIEPSDGTCRKLAKMYIRGSNAVSYFVFCYHDSA